MRVDWLLDCDPRPVQIEALRRSVYGFVGHDSVHEEVRPRRIQNAFVSGWGHFMEMRLGKTPTALAEDALFVRDAGIERVVVFSPATYVEGWAAEAERFGFELPAIAYDSRKTSRVADEIKAAKGRCLLVVNYEAMRAGKCNELLDDFIDSRTKINADESIKIKNPDSITTKAALAFSKKAAVTRCLTGLPMTQGPQDIWAQFRFMGRENGVRFHAFRNRFCKMGGFKRKTVMGAKNEEELRAKIDASSFLAFRRDWVSFKEPEYFTERLSLSDRQKTLYDEMDRDFVAVLSDEVEVSADMIISKMMKLQQISSGFLYDEKKQLHTLEDPRKTAKMQRLLHMLENELTGKVVIAYHYSASGDALYECLKAYNPAIIRSKMWMKEAGTDVDAEKRRFNEDPNSKVIITQIASTKYGHDLTGTPLNRCADMVFYETTYSLDDRFQIERRITAAEQVVTPRYFDFIASKVEAAAVKALAAKEKVADAVIGSYGGARPG